MSMCSMYTLRTTTYGLRQCSFFLVQPSLHADLIKRRFTKTGRDCGTKEPRQPYTTQGTGRVRGSTTRNKSGRLLDFMTRTSGKIAACLYHYDGRRELGKARIVWTVGIMLSGQRSLLPTLGSARVGSERERGGRRSDFLSMSPTRAQTPQGRAILIVSSPHKSGICTPPREPLQTDATERTYLCCKKADGM